MSCISSYICHCERPKGAWQSHPVAVIASVAWQYHPVAVIASVAWQYHPVAVIASDRRERGNLIEKIRFIILLDCFVAALLAMTIYYTRLLRPFEAPNDI